ncbi:MAG: GNAT family N-acetyltransferase [Mycobacteriales bacterium]
MLIREERPADRPSVANVHQLAFGDHGDVVIPLIDDLRVSLGSEEGLSLVAVDHDVVVGHVLFTRSLLDAPSQLVDVQVLSPVGAVPEHQRQGVGGALIRQGVEELDRRGVPLVFLEGSPSYYPRLGFSAGREQHHPAPLPALLLADTGRRLSGAAA